MKNTTQLALTPRQACFTSAYTDPKSTTFGNCYQSAITSGYSTVTARNLTHLKPKWLSDVIGGVALAIQPEEITTVLSSVIYSPAEPTIIKLKAIELLMKSYGMLQKQGIESKTVSINVNLTD